ncbi:MAG: hypothetical protein OEV74_06755 [Cyclobacteriaceae bacterium]|nr:hypothetical protein [Cyclobacteriaceae bacterium]MDH5251122.1 hypothetical protein [Cyclobacteriaceae bacterium]
MRNIIASMAVTLVVIMQSAVAQKIDEERMERDIAVAENVLSTLIKQQFNNQRTFFPLEIKGTYQAGYGVTFSLPADYTTPIAFSIAGADNDVVVWGNDQFNFDFNVEDRQHDEEERAAAIAEEKSIRLRDRSRERKRLDMDSIRDAYNLKVIEAAKTFLVDYADMITQLGAQEKVIISNQGNQPRMWVGRYFNAPKRTHLSIEALKSDITQFKQGKISRDQALAKVKVVNTETVENVEPDLELLSSIFSRLYSQDLSKTYFTGDNVYFERLRDFGVIYYMQVYSGIERGDFSRRYVMPTLGLTDVDQETKDQKVKELYPKFEQELKENILEYGRTLKSLKDNEVLVFQVTLTKCAGCGIPSTLELSIKGAVLMDFSAGKVDRNTAVGKFSIKKGENQ